jgi:hypothetical protein
MAVVLVNHELCSAVRALFVRLRYLSAVHPANVESVRAVRLVLSKYLGP